LSKQLVSSPETIVLDYEQLGKDFSQLGPKVELNQLKETITEKDKILKEFGVDEIYK
jgi:hypothetical protein